jgi:hypothetical protein
MNQTYVDYEMYEWVGGFLCLLLNSRRVLTPLGVGIISLAISRREIHGCRWPPYTL